MCYSNMFLAILIHLIFIIGLLSGWAIVINEKKHSFYRGVAALLHSGSYRGPLTYLLAAGNVLVDILLTATPLPSVLRSTMHWKDKLSVCLWLISAGG